MFLARDDVVAVMDTSATKRLSTVFAWPPPPSWITGYRPYHEDRGDADLHGREAAASGEKPWMADSIAFSHDGKLAALMGRRKANEYEIRIVDFRNDKTVGEFLFRNRVLVREVNPYGTADDGMRPELKCVEAVFSPDGTRLAVAVQGEIRMCEIGAGKKAFRSHVDPRPAEPTVVEHEGRVDAVAFSPDGSLVATAGSDCMTRLWSTRRGTELHRWLHDWVFGCECSVAFSPDGTLLAIDVGGQVDLVRCSDGKLLHQFVALGRKGGRTGGGYPSMIAFTPDGHRLLVCRYHRKAMVWWDVGSGEKIGETVRHMSDQDRGLYGKTSWSDTGEGDTAVFSPSLRWFGETYFDATAYFHWDTSTGKKTFKTGHPNGFTSTRFSSDESLFALGVPHQPVRIIDVRTGATVRELKGPPGSAFPRAFLDEGHILVCDHDDDSTQFWDVDSGREVYRLRGHRIRACSQNGRYAASVRDRVWPAVDPGREIVSSTVLIWDLRLLKDPPTHIKQEDP
ncbi:MAG: hypothetical protein HQ582_30275 [Planctomycetes bacterium]|nr:hypothetical protein [Planctomycetota bacterium]